MFCTIATEDHGVDLHLFSLGLYSVPAEKKIINIIIQFDFFCRFFKITPGIVDGWENWPEYSLFFLYRCIGTKWRDDSISTTSKSNEKGK